MIWLISYDIISIFFFHNILYSELSVSLQIKFSHADVYIVFELIPEKSFNYYSLDFDKNI